MYSYLSLLEAQYLKENWQTLMPDGIPLLQVSMIEKKMKEMYIF